MSYTVEIKNPQGRNKSLKSIKKKGVNIELNDHNFE